MMVIYTLSIVLKKDFKKWFETKFLPDFKTNGRIIGSILPIVLNYKSKKVQ